MCGRAGDTGGAICGGGACLFAVPWRMDEYVFLKDDMSTSPNFFCWTSEAVEGAGLGATGGGLGGGAACCSGGDAEAETLRIGGRGGATGEALFLNLAAAAATLPAPLSTEADVVSGESLLLARLHEGSDEMASGDCVVWAVNAL